MPRNTPTRTIARPTVPVTLIYEHPARHGRNARPRHQLMARPGDTVLELILRNQLDIEHDCGGICGCTTCHIRAIAGAEHLSSPDADERQRVAQTPDHQTDSRLACQATITGPGPITITVPD